MADTNTAAIESLIRAIERNIKADQESISQLRDVFDPRGGVASKKAAAEKKEYSAAEARTAILRKSTSNMSNMNNAIIKAQAQMEMYGDINADQTSALINAGEEALSTAVEMDDAQRSSIEMTLAQIAAGVDVTKGLDTLTTQLSDVAGAEVDKLEATVKATDATKKGNIQLLEWTDNLKSSIGKLFSFKGALGLATLSMVRSFDNLEKTAKTQAPMMSALAGEGLAAVERFGVSQSDFMDIYDQNTSAILGVSDSMTSMEDSAYTFIDTYSAVSEELRAITGNNTDAMRLAAESMTLLSKTGVEMSVAEMKEQISGQGGLAKSLETLARISNKSGAEITQMVGGLIEDSAMRYEMLGLNDKERKNKIRQIALQTTELATTGIGITRALEFQKTLASITQSQDPKSFMKNIGKTMAIAGAAGMDSGMVDQYRQEMISGAPDPEFMQKFTTTLDEAVAGMTGKKGISNSGTRLMGMQLRSMMPAQTTKMIELGSSAAVKQLGISETQLGVLRDQNQNIKAGANAFINWSKDWYETGKAVFSSPEFGIGGSIIEFAGAMYLAKNALAAITAMFSVAGTSIGAFFSGLIVTGPAIAATISTAAVTAAGAIGYAFGSAFDNLWAAIAQDSHIAMQDFVGSTTESAINLWDDMWSAPAATLKGMGESLAINASSAWGDVEDTFTSFIGMGDSIIQGLSGMWDKISTTFGASIDRVWAAVAVETGIAMENFVGGTIDGLMNMTDAIVSAPIETLKGMGDSIVLDFNETWNDIASTFDALTSWFDADNNKAKEDQNKRDVENAMKIQEELQKVTAAIIEADNNAKANNNKQTAAITEQTATQRESSEKDRESSKTESRLRTMYVPAF